MRARLINEKFIEDSDPIKDMGIGAPVIIKDWEKKIRNLDRKITKENNIQFAIGNNTNSLVDSTGIIWDIFLYNSFLLIRTSKWDYYINKKTINTENHIKNILDILKLSFFVEPEFSYEAGSGVGSEYYNIKIKPEYLKYFKKAGIELNL